MSAGGVDEALAIHGERDGRYDLERFYPTRPGPWDAYTRAYDRASDARKVRLMHWCDGDMCSHTDHAENVPGGGVTDKDPYSH